MATKPSLYHFLDANFGYPFVAHFYKQELDQFFAITLVFSTKTMQSNRRFGHPLALVDWWRFQIEKYKIKQRYRLFKCQLIFTDDTNAAAFIKKIPNHTNAICTGFNQIFGRQLIEKFTNFVNLHPSLLPLYRGPTPIEWCLENKETHSGWTLHRVEEKIDHGTILFQEALEIKGKSAKEISAEMVDQAKIVLYQYLLQLKNETPFKIQRLDAKKYYKVQVEYKSFFKSNIQRTKNIK